MSPPNILPEPQSSELTLPSGLDLTGRIQGTFDINESICSGGMSDIFRFKFDDRLVAVKLFRIDARDAQREKVIQHLIREVNACFELQREGPNQYITELLGVLNLEKGRPGIVLQYYENNDAPEYIKKKKFTEDAKGDIILNIARGLKHMHDHNVVHGDMKLRNIVFDDKGTPKICDFGFSRILHISGFTTVTIGTTSQYTAPEILEELLESEDDPTKVTSKAGDIYAFAILAAEIFMEKKYDALNNRAMIAFNQVKNNKRPPESEVNSKYFPLLVDCWMNDPDERLRVEEVVHSLEHIRQIGRYEPRKT